MRITTARRLALRLALLGSLALPGAAGCLTDDAPALAELEQDIDAPMTVTATANSSTSITVSWSAVPDAFKYYVYQQAGAGPVTYVGTTLAPETSRVLTRLTPGTTYTFTIYAVHADSSESGPSGAATATTPASDAPTGVTVTPTSTTQIDVAWSAVAGASKYYVYQSASGGPASYIGTVLAPGTSRSVSGLSPNTTYCYQLQTAFPDGTESALSAPVCASTSNAAGAPAFVTATAISDTRINVQWSAASGATKYYVYQSAPGGGDPLTATGSVVAPGTAFVAANLQTNTVYCFRVSTVRADTSESGLSSSACATTGSVPGGGFQLFYKFDERTGTTAADSSGYGRTGTLAGGAAFSTTDRAQIDDNGAAVSIPDSASAVVTTPGAAALNLTGPFTVAFWAKVPVAADVRFAGMHPAACGAGGWEIGQTTASGLYFQGEGGAGLAFGAGIPAGTWAHVAVTYTGGTLRSYVNGVETASGAYAPTNSAPGALELGHPGGCAGGAVLLDQLQIYGQALAAGQIATLGTLPAAPADLTVSDATSVSMTLTWTPVAGATSYILEKGTAPGATTFFTHIPAGSSFTADHLTPSTQYVWRIRAVVNGLFSDASNEAQSTTLAGPDAPTNVMATVNPTRVNLTWSPVATAFKYYVFMSTSGGAYEYRGSVLATSELSFDVANLTPGTLYSFQVQAEDAGMVTSPMSAPVSVTTPSM